LIEFFLKHALSWILIETIIATLIISLLPSKEKICRIVALLFSLDLLIAVLWMIFSKFDPNLAALQYVENYRWFGDTIRIKLAVDGLSISMVFFLTSLLERSV